VGRIFRCQQKRWNGMVIQRRHSGNRTRAL
jgi:hypothetical protein